MNYDKGQRILRWERAKETLRSAHFQIALGLVLTFFWFTFVALNQMMGELNAVV